MLYSILRKSMIMWLCVVVLLLTSSDAHGHNSTDIQSGNLTGIIFPRCPGECVHIITAWLCDHILEQADCATEYLRCCVSEDATYGTEVVTSPPLLEDEEPPLPPVTVTLSTPTTSIHLTTTTHPPSISSTSSQPTSIEKLAQCSGVCMAINKFHHCENTVNNTLCDKEGKACCNKVTATTPTPKSPPCPGSCVSALFSLLCDRITYDYYCEDAGRCCLPPPQITTTSPSPGPCPGKCIPAFLSGVCNRPSELILKTTDCHTGTICCYDPSPPAVTTTKPVIRLPPTTSVPPPPEKFGGSVNHICPGTCIDPLLRFTCTRQHMIYDRFSCITPNTICCAPVEDVMRFEQKTRRQPSTVVVYPFNVTNREQTTTIKTSLTRIRNPYICGIKGTERRRGRIVGGRDSLPGEWCWQVALINSQNVFLCGGTLIGTQWVLTAAHCVTSLVKSGEAIFVRAGESDLTQTISSQTKRVVATYVHHNYNSQTLDNNIALLKIQTPFELNRNVCLLCLPARGVTRQAGKRCIVTGYGFQREGGPAALKIREAHVPIVDERDCTVQINAVTEKLFVLPASSFCAGGEEGNDACLGDGGGPLVCEVDGYYELTGIVSWGFGCGRLNVPGIYVKVSSFIGWINQIVSVNNL